MFAITSPSLLQLISFVVNIILLTLVVSFGLNKPYKKALVVFLTTCILWSMFSFMSNQPIPFDQAVFWGRMVSFFALAVGITYAYFVSVFIGNVRYRKIVGWAGGGLLLFVLVLNITGYVPQNFRMGANGIVIKEYGVWMILLVAAGFAFLISSLAFLIRKYKMAADPEEKNRVGYLLLGLVLLIAFGACFAIFPVQKYSVDHLGHLANAIVITYSVIRYRLIDLKLFLRKSVVFACITFVIAAAFMVMFIALNFIMRGSLSTPTGYIFTALMVIFMAMVFNPLRIIMERAVEKLFYGTRYDYRQMVMSFASRMNNVIDLNELAEAMLRPIARAISARQVSLLFPQNGHFTSQFAERLVPGEPVIPISLRTDGPVINRLAGSDEALLKDTVFTDTEFKGMWQEERNSIKASEIEIFVPVKSKKKLVAVLAISKKKSHGYYSKDDIDMLLTLAHEAGIVIENAQLYAKARQRANTDELTNLYNHRYFHERLDEEIARCSRFGNIFSLVIIDMDNFKAYNDACGHLAGDEALKQMGQIIRAAMRNTDFGFRYGGDEFAILLPGTPLQGTSKVAERIRIQLQDKVELEGVPQTCSLGVASWPTDGVMRDEIIRSADAAVYYAKHIGGNRVCWACEVALSDVLRMETSKNKHNKNVILSTIYALAATVDAKDHHTYGHSKKVGTYATRIAEVMGYKHEGLERIRAAALLHDIGKIGISDHLLTKREPLTEEDKELIRAHPGLGVSILKHVESLNGCLAAVQYHHERFDGRGYPAGLKGQNIPLDARILAVADSYDAMTSERPYRSFVLSKEDALKELVRCSGSQFDPKVVEVFVKIMGGVSEPAHRGYKSVEA